MITICIYASGDLRNMIHCNDYIIETDDNGFTKIYALDEYGNEQVELITNSEFVIERTYDEGS